MIPTIDPLYFALLSHEHDGGVKYIQVFALSAFSLSCSSSIRGSWCNWPWICSSCAILISSWVCISLNLLAFKCYNSFCNLLSTCSSCSILLPPFLSWMASFTMEWNWWSLLHMSQYLNVYVILMLLQSFSFSGQWSEIPSTIYLTWVNSNMLNHSMFVKALTIFFFHSCLCLTMSSSYQNFSPLLTHIAQCILHSLLPHSLALHPLPMCPVLIELH